ncbi:MAG TPA: DUF1499 domain-containing protein [Gemmatimonadota bacterium]|nr:DUF1499 domain-containing protein [Gemmatimonadota bacterium]
MTGLTRRLRRLVVHDVRTGDTDVYPDLQPLDVPLGPGPAFAAALAAARSMPGWTIVSTEPEAGEIRAEARTPRLGFIDDVRIRTRPLSGGGTRIDVRSTSRLGICDFGTNARRIRSYLERLALRASPAG